MGAISIRTLTVWIERWLSTLVVLVMAGLVGWYLYDSIAEVFHTVSCLAAEVQLNS